MYPLDTSRRRNFSRLLRWSVHFLIVFIIVKYSYQRGSLNNKTQNLHHLCKSIESPILPQTLSSRKNTSPNEKQIPISFLNHYQSYIEPVHRSGKTNYCFDKIDFDQQTPSPLTSHCKVSWHSYCNFAFTEKFNWKYVENNIAGNVTNGCYTPPDCVVDQHLTIVIPYRDREVHLKMFTLYMHHFLQQQKRSYCIVVVEQIDFGHFNRAKLMNIGYIEGNKEHHYNKNQKSDCFAFHDVDMVPDFTENIYMCHPEKSIHLVDKIDKYNYATQYNAGQISTSGAVLIPSVQYEDVNGHSNWFWGWGMEDQDMAARLRDHEARDNDFDYDGMDEAELPVAAIVNHYFQDGLTKEGGGEGLMRQDLYGRYSQFRHKHGFTNGGGKLKLFNENGNLVAGAMRKYFRMHDGLTQTRYDMIGTERRKAFTKFTVDVRPAVITAVRVNMEGEQGVWKINFRFFFEKLLFCTLSNFRLILFQTRLSRYLNINPVYKYHHECTFVRLAGVYYAHASDSSIQSVRHEITHKSRLHSAKLNCEKESKTNGQCNMFSMIQYWQAFTVPFPLITKPAHESNHDGKWDSYVRNCPHELAWFQVVDKIVKVKLPKGKETMPFKFVYDLSMDMKFIELPVVGGLVYSDNLIMESRRFSGRWLNLGSLPVGHHEKVVTNSTDGLTVKLRNHGPSLRIDVEIVFNQMVPGIGL